MATSFDLKKLKLNLRYYEMFLGGICNDAELKKVLTWDDRDVREINVLPIVGRLYQLQFLNIRIKKNIKNIY